MSRSLIIDKGFNVCVRGYWENIELKGYYHFGLNNNSSNSIYELSIKPINYFGFCLGYRIKIINSFKSEPPPKNWTNNQAIKMGNFTPLKTHNL
jgi:hypothetical protein